MTPRAMERLAARLSARDLTLLRTLQRSRFATTKQLARFARAGHASSASALRQTSRALRALDELSLVGHLERRIGGRRSGSAGLVWALTPLGHRLLTQVDGRPESRRHRKEPEPSTAFLEHTLAVTEVHLILFELSHDSVHDVQLVAFEHEPESWRRYLDRQRGAVHLRTDAYAELRIGEFHDSYFLEVDRATEAPVIVVRKCLQYQEYRRSGLEQKLHDVFPAVVWITPHEKRAQQLKVRLQEEPGITKDLFSVVTIDDLRHHIVAGPADAL
ncbi:replication-relaxation family protein [Microbacterium sp.]|uniref:replication-relaxation family protein n=1 Tax=Microbacterium sp. TaxID=51671 RepID=UPI001AD2581B|nr:replication-relaxation family protein [Microbacterium sp.]MBN9156928.1 replication-relaxation family protein [Microbacterium sp.]